MQKLAPGEVHGPKGVASRRQSYDTSPMRTAFLAGRHQSRAASRPVALGDRRTCGWSRSRSCRPSRRNGNAGAPKYCTQRGRGVALGTGKLP
jgi:hypothetical protein